MFAEMISSLKLPVGSRCVKYLMFVFNLLFVITGIILLSIGATIHAVYHDYQHFLDNRFFSVPNLLIAIGAIIFVIAFFGCCGAVRENYCMIITFATCLVLVFILELAGGISGYVLKSHATEVIGDKMRATMKDYTTNGSEIPQVWDALQEQFSCCGTNNASEWLEYLDGKLPNSCCGPQVVNVSKEICDLNAKDLHHDGCLPKFLEFVRSHATQLGAVGIGIAVVQAVGIWFAAILARSIRNSYETV